jgi:diphthine synthase
MLSFVGLGLYDERSITVEGRDRIRDADDVFLETYTSRLVGASPADLESVFDTRITVCDRSDVEQSPEPILAAGGDGHAVFCTAGDPMIATTHVDLRLRAADRGIDTEIVHGITAQAAASSLTGLQNYRFGPSTTLPFPENHGADGLPTSVTSTIEENHTRGLHTLVFLDIEAAEERFMTGDVAAELLAPDYGDRLGVVVARAGSPDPTVRGDRIERLATQSVGDPLHLLVMPGDCHPLETEALTSFAGVPEECLDFV